MRIQFFRRQTPSTTTATTATTPTATPTCQADLGQGICIPASSCPGITYIGRCTGPANIQCCFNRQCTVPQGKGYCQDLARQNCSGGQFFAGSAPNWPCPGDNNIQCCVEAQNIIVSSTPTATPNSSSSLSSTTTPISSPPADASASSSTTTSSSRLAGGQIAGIVVGVVVATSAMFALIAFLVVRRRRKRRKEAAAAMATIQPTPSGADDDPKPTEAESPTQVVEEEEEEEAVPALDGRELSELDARHERQELDTPSYPSSDQPAPAARRADDHVRHFKTLSELPGSSVPVSSTTPLASTRTTSNHG